MNDLKLFIKSYWEYFLELEEQFLETKRFVAFDKANAKAYSIEYLKLYQAICSEIDVVGKEIAVAINPQFKIDNNTNIKKWGYEVQKKLPMLKDAVVIFNDEDTLRPFQDWEYEQHTTIDKNGKPRTGLRIKDEKKPIFIINMNEYKDNSDNRQQINKKVMKYVLDNYCVNDKIGEYTVFVECR